MAGAAVGGVKICVWRGLEARSMTFVHVIVIYRFFSAWCVTTCGLILLSVRFITVLSDCSPFEKKNKIIKPR